MGKFKFGHTHPEYSNSGIISLFAEVYAGAGKVADLSLDDLSRPEVGNFLGQIEQSVVHYGSSTGFFGTRMFEGGPGYLSAAVLYENMVIESYDPEHQMPFPLVAIYPKEGTFWSDHPVGIVDREWVTDEHRDAATKYIDYLSAEAQQRRALEFGFRPADVTLALGAPIDVEHGVDPLEPKTTLEVPSAQVARDVIKLWKKHKKHSNIVLVLDVSGSMKGERLEAAKQGAMQLIDMLGDEDQLSFVPFAGQPRMVLEDANMGSHRQEAKNVVRSLFADGGTALYDAIHTAQQHLADNPHPEMITAIVVLTDGDDTGSRMPLTQLLDEIRTDNETRMTKVFTIGYGGEANTEVLEQISNVTQGKRYEGTTNNIREVFKDILTFF